ncbi:MAG: ThuA domain-containing protein [Thermoguttaceae bacterium]|nr:ThuA domain-containing protein [Thermoguttaceae bacterium]
MKRRQWLLCSAGIVAAGFGSNAMLSQASAAETDTPSSNAPIRVLFIYGGHPFEEQPMTEMLQKLPRMAVTEMEYSKAKLLLKPGIQKDYDVLLFYDYCSDIQNTPEEQANMENLLKEGMNVVFWHHAIMPHFHGDYEIIGGRYHFTTEKFQGQDVPASTYEHGVDIAVEVADPSHPIVKGIKPFTIHDESYGLMSVNPKVHVLLTTQNPKCTKEILWTKEYGKSQIVYLALGHDSQAWKNPVFPELLTRCIEWAHHKK